MTNRSKHPRQSAHDLRTEILGWFVDHGVAGWEVSESFIDTMLTVTDADVIFTMPIDHAEFIDYAKRQQLASFGFELGAKITVIMYENGYVNKSIQDTHEPYSLTFVEAENDEWVNGWTMGEDV